MADNDDVNKSDKPVNGKVPKHLRDVFEQRDYNVSYEHLSTKEGMPKLSQRLEALEHLKGMTAAGTSERQQIEENIGYTEADMAEEIDRLEKVYGAKYNESLAASVETFTKYRNINSRTTTMSSQQRFGRMAQTHKDRYLPTEMIEARNQQLMEEASQEGSRLAGKARELGPEDDTSALSEGASRIGAIQEEIAFNKRLMKTQARQGLSTEKLINRGEDLDQAVSDFLQKKGIEQKVDSGNVRSYDEEFKVMGHMRENRNELQEKYNEAIDSGSEMASIFAEKLKKANDALDEQTRIVKRMSDKGMDRGGGENWAMAGKFAGAISMAAGAASVVGVNYEIEQTQQRAAYANLVNEKYENTRAFAGGDMGAFLRLAKTDQFAKEYSDSLRSRTQTLKGIEAGALITQGVTNGVAVASGPGDWFMKGGGKALDVANAAAAPTIQGTLLATRLGYGIEQGQTGYQAYMAARQLGDAVNAIPSAALNAYVGGKRGFFRSGVGLGMGRGEYMQSMVDNITNFRNAGMDYKQAAALGGQAIAEIGTTEDATAAGLRAARAQQLGIVGADQYVGMAGTLSNVGGGTGDLEDIMAKAVTSGMENAKNINQMVSATAAMAQYSAASGLNVSDVAQERLTASVQALRQRGVNKNLAAAAAANAFSSYANAESEMGTFADYQFRARAEDIYGGTTMEQSSAMAKMKTFEAQSILKGGEKARLIAEEYGLTNKIGMDESGQFKSEKDKERFERLVRAKIQKGLIDEIGTLGALSRKGSLDRITDYKMGKIEYSDLQDVDKQIYKGQTGQSVSGLMFGGQADQLPKYLRRPNTTSDEASMQKFDVLSAKFAEQEFQAGQTELGKLGDLPRLLEMLSVAVSTNTPEKMAAEVKEAAENLKAPVSTFGDGAKVFKDGSKDFKEAVTKFVTYMDKLGVGGTKPTIDIPKSNGNNTGKKWGDAVRGR